MTASKLNEKADNVLRENEDLKLRLRESEETLKAIMNGEVDAIVVKGKDGEMVYSLQSAETPYRIILEEMNEGAVIVSRDGIILYCNRRFAELLALPRELVIGSKAISYIVASDVSGFLKLFRSSRRNKTSGIASFVSAEKNLIHTKISFMPLPEIIGGDISILVSDITEISDYKDYLKEMVEKRSAELKQVNLELAKNVIDLQKKEQTIGNVARKYRTLYDKMRQSEEKYRDLVEGANSIVMTIDPNGYITFMNSYGLSFFGYTEEEVIGRHVTGTTIPRRDSSNRDLSQMADEIIRAPEKFQTNEHENMKKDGTLVWVSWTNKAITDRSGKITGILAIGNDITKLKDAEKAFIESEEKYRKIVETAAEGILTADVNGTIQYINKKMAEMLGAEVSEILGKNTLEFSYELDNEQLNNLRNTVRSGSLNGEYKFRRKDGSLQWTSFNAVPLHDSEGRHIGNLAMHTDINEKKKSEEELYRSEERFRTAFEKGAVAMAMVTLKSEYMRVNRAFCELTGYSEKELIGMTFVQLTHPDDLKINMEGFDKVLKSLVPSFRMEERYVRKNGEVIWVDLSNAPVRNKEGEIDYMVTHVQDINERKKFENELRSSREKLDMALKSGHIGIWERDLQTDNMVWDSSMENIFKLAPGTFTGTYSGFEELINEEDLPHFRKALNNSIVSGELSETVFRTNLKNGNSKYISTKALVSKNDNGIPVSMTGICYDVTSMKEGAEKAVLRLTEELLRSNRELESFAYVASHDLQEPLRMVASFTQMLSQRYGDKLDENAREYIKFAVDGAKRMYELINGLLAYSRIQTKGKEFSVVDMSNVYQKVMRNLGLMIKERNASVITGNLPVVFGDESQMIQLVQNLIENAIKFTRDNPEIHFSAREEDDKWLFSVKDNGMGIEPEYFERIFKIFQQLMPKDQYEGTGIGLAVCRRIVERHNGKIWVESIPGKGSTFIFTIPRK